MKNESENKKWVHVQFPSSVQFLFGWLCEETCWNVSNKLFYTDNSQSSRSQSDCRDQSSVLSVSGWRFTGLNPPRVCCARCYPCSDASRRYLWQQWSPSGRACEHKEQALIKCSSSSLSVSHCLSACLSLLFLSLYLRYWFVVIYVSTRAI